MTPMHIFEPEPSYKIAQKWHFQEMSKNLTARFFTQVIPKKS